MPGGIFVGRADIYDGDKPIFCPLQELLCRDGLEVIFLLQVGVDQQINLGQIVLGDVPDYAEKGDG